MKKEMAKVKKAGVVTEASTPEEIHTRIWSIDLKSMGTMDAGEFVLLREKTNPDDRRHLDYLVERMQLEMRVRTIVKEEIGKLSKEELAKLREGLAARA